MKWVLGLLIFAMGVLNARADTACTNSGPWDSAVTWDNGVPVEGSGVTIPAPFSVLITNESPLLSAADISGTLVFSNWATSLKATNVTVRSGGVLMHAGPFLGSDMSNRVHVVCTNFNLEGGGRVDVKGRGYAGGAKKGSGAGPGAGGGDSGTYGVGGAGHGGGGPGSLGGRSYGALAFPETPGSGGGGSWNYAGSPGGGAVRIDAADSVTLNGTIDADGGTAGGGSAGSGGAILIGCRVVTASTSGVVTAEGGKASSLGTPAAGGRISLLYNSADQASWLRPGIRFSANAGGGNDLVAVGTVFLSDTGLLIPAIGDVFQGWIWVAGSSQWAVDALSISNNVGLGSQSGFSLTVTNDVWVNAAGSLGLASATVFRCSRLVLTNQGNLYVYSGPTNGVSTNYGGLVAVSNVIWIGSNSWMNLYPAPIDGGAGLVEADVLIVGAFGGVRADGNGFRGGGYRTDGKGYGKGNKGNYSGTGAGHGGKGSYVTTVYGNLYGSTNAPILPGSGGGGGYPGQGGAGGGVIRFAIRDRLQIAGTVSANGGSGGAYSVYGDGGGSGGSILMTARRFSGTGLIRANGGAAGTVNGGSGAGGRIAIGGGFTREQHDRLVSGQSLSGLTTNASWPDFTGVFSVTNGNVGVSAESGSVLLLSLPVPLRGTLMLVR